MKREYVEGLVTAASSDDSCYLWPHARNQAGYGNLSVDGKTLAAHRVALEVKIGRPIKPNHIACHTCDMGLPRFSGQLS